MANYVDSHFEKVQNVPGGTLCQIFGSTENANCSVALVKMNENDNGIKHYHNNIYEIYVFVKGKGKIIINENENDINEGDCYIIEPNNTHYIKSITEMEFICICTPPWTAENEIVVDTISKGKNILKNKKYGILQILSNDNYHNIRRLKINDKYIHNDKEKKYRRVYYFIKGEGNIIIDNKIHEIRPGYCYEINNNSNEVIVPFGDIDFISIYDKLSTNNNSLYERNNIKI